MFPPSLSLPFASGHWFDHRGPSSLFHFSFWKNGVVTVPLLFFAERGASATSFPSSTISATVWAISLETSPAFFFPPPPRAFLNFPLLPILCFFPELHFQRHGRLPPFMTPLLPPPVIVFFYLTSPSAITPSQFVLPCFTPFSCGRPLFISSPPNAPSPSFRVSLPVLSQMGLRTLSAYTLTHHLNLLLR